jgi:hypothetical protein
VLQKTIHPANDNGVPVKEIVSPLDWVRPVMVAMRGECIPDPVAQDTMAFLIERLGKYLDSEG